MKKFHVCSVSICPRSRVDAQKIHNYLAANGLLFTESFKDADLTVISTCAYSQYTEDRSVGSIKYYMRHKFGFRLQLANLFFRLRRL